MKIKMQYYHPILTKIIIRQMNLIIIVIRHVFLDRFACIFTVFLNTCCDLHLFELTSFVFHEFLSICVDCH